MNADSNDSVRFAMSTIVSTPMTPAGVVEPPTTIVRPTLEPGDHLSRAEFERRYDARPDIRKAELIEGVVHMPSPARYRKHGRPTSLVNYWLGDYEVATQGVEIADNCSVRLDFDNEPQPDCFLRIVTEHGGQSRTSTDDFVEGAPELIAEVAASSASYDLHSKMNVYRRNGVREYLVVLTEEQQVRWFVLHEGRFVEIQPDAGGIFRSEVFPGLWLDAPALLAGNLVQVKAVLQQGVSSPEHAAFVQKLNANPNPRS